MHKPRLRQATGSSPLYQQVKEHVTRLIGRGGLQAGDRVPSEQELMTALQVSRMTAHRALRELMAEGWLFRVPGLGSFVAPPKPPVTTVEIRDLTEDVIMRGGAHTADLLVNENIVASGDLARRFGVPTGTSLYYCRLLHRDNGWPMQVEDRWALPAMAQDFGVAVSGKSGERPSLSHQRLTGIAPYQEMEHEVEAVLADIDIAGLLDLMPRAACLRLTRRSWSGGRVSTLSRCWIPGTRYTLSGFSRPTPG
jgi:GntR family transcriptional regulator, histidine utilization repressor